MNGESLLNLRKFLAPEIVHGAGALQLAGRHAKNLGATKALIVTDPGVQKAGWTSKVEDSLRASDVDYVVFNQLTPNPKDDEVMNGASVCRSEGCDLIIAVGGGSPMDCAKGIGAVIGNPGNVLDFEGIDMIPSPGPPLIFVPTTAGTSADVSQFAIILDTRREVKIAIISKMVIPDIALVDPETTTTMPPGLTAATGMDALCHAFEAYVSTAASPLTDMAALTAVRLISESLRGAYTSPLSMKYRDPMMTASLMAGLAFSNASLGLVHAMAHSLGGALDLPHGECNALLLEKVVVHNYPAAPGRYDRLASAMGLDTRGLNNEHRAAFIADSIASLRKTLGITFGLKDLGVSVNDIPRLAGFAFDDPCLATNPRQTEIKEIETIYRQIYENR